MSQATFDSYFLAVQQLEERQRQLDQRLAEFGAREPYREPVAALRCFKGIDTVTAVCLVAVLHDFHVRSLKRWILPVAVFGSSLVNSIQRGYL